MSQNTLKSSLLIVMIALTLLAAPAGASPVIYPTSTGWTAAVANIITVPFDAQAGSTAYTPYNTSGGLTAGDVNFVGFTSMSGEYNLKVYNPFYDASLNRGGTGPSLGGGYSPGYLLATLPGAGVYALAVEIATETKNKSVSITLLGQTYTITSPADSSRTFWGVTSDVPIPDIKFSAIGTFTMIDDFSYGDIPGGEEVPEPMGLLLGATGMAAILLARRMRRLC